VLGVCNPKGEHDAYNGLYFRESEMRAMVDNKSLHGLPVRTEHGTGDIGKIVSTYMRDDGGLQCLLSLEGRDLHDKIAQGFVRDGVALELSLGYTVDIQQSRDKLHATDKKVLEVSLVKKGARQGCHILAFEDVNKPAYVRSAAQTKMPSVCDVNTLVTNAGNEALCFEQFVSQVEGKALANV